MADNKISVYSLSDLKNTSDDAIPNYLNSLKFKQSHTLSDVRLALGYTAFAICAACFYWDYKFGFESTKCYTAIAVAIYTCVNGALTFWIWAVEKGIVYVGTSPSGDKIEISTSVQKNTPIYELTVTCYTAARPKVPTTLKISRPFTEWFDATGHFVPLPFQKIFAGQVPIIGKADPTRAHGKVVQPTPSPADLQQAMDNIAALEASVSTGNETPKKNSKGRKKA